MEDISSTELRKLITRRSGLLVLDLSNRGLPKVPDSVTELSELEGIWLRDNNLTELPTSINQLENLRELNLADNNLSYLPAEIGDLKELRVLDVNNNKLAVVHPRILKLPNLRLLNLGDNALSTLPAEIGDLKELWNLNLGNNRLAVVPPNILKLQKLAVLHLHNNRLTTLPAEIGDMELQFLNLNGNPFTVNALASLKELKERKNGKINIDIPETFEVSNYPMSSSPRGICLIINNLCFDDERKNRYGGEKDADALGQLFRGELDFIVNDVYDLENIQMQRVARKFADENHSDYDVFVCIIMSHGEEHGLIEGVKGQKIRIGELMSEFKPMKCPTLAEKPKIFIIQACRGTEEDESVQPTTDATRARFFTDSAISRSVTPQELDFLLAFSTVPGYVSYRTPESGSIFIQTLVEVIRRYHKKEHLADMLTIVTRRVAAEKGSQVPAPVSTLRYKLYL